MSKIVKAKAETGSKYSAEHVATLLAASPITYAKAVELADEFGFSLKSIIAKIKSLESAGEAIAYIPKPKPAKREKGLTKVELVAEIEQHIGADQGALDGLEKAPARTLGRLLLLV